MNQFWKGATSVVQDNGPDSAEHGEHEKFVCRCGNDTFRVYSHVGYYTTYVECLACGACGPRLGEPEADSTVVHSG